MAAPGKKKCDKSRSRSRTGRKESAKRKTSSKCKGSSKKKRSKKGWTCYTHFYTEMLAKLGIKLSPVSCEVSFAQMHKSLHGLSAIPFNSLCRPGRNSRHSGSDTFTILPSGVDSYKYSLYRPTSSYRGHHAKSLPPPPLPSHRLYLSFLSLFPFPPLPFPPLRIRPLKYSYFKVWGTP